MYKIQPIRAEYKKTTNLNFSAPFKIIYRNGWDLLIFKKPVFDFSLLYPRKNGLILESKVFALDTEIKDISF